MFSALDAKGYLPSPLSEPALTRLADLLRALLARHHGGTSPFRPDGGPAGNGTAVEVSCAPIRKPKLLKSRDLLGSFGLQRPASSFDCPPRSGSFGFRRARVRSAFRRARVRLVSAGLGFVWIFGANASADRCHATWRPRLSSPAPAQSARSLLMTILRSGGNRAVSLHDHRNFRQTSCGRRRVAASCPARRPQARGSTLPRHPRGRPARRGAARRLGEASQPIARRTMTGECEVRARRRLVRWLAASETLKFGGLPTYCGC